MFKGKPYHVMVDPRDVSRYVLMPGDVDRVEKIARHLSNAREVGKHRQFITVTGEYKGVRVTTTSSGIGPSAVEIAITELAMIGADTFIRVGSTGALQLNIDCGDIIITTAAVRLEGTSEKYACVEYPAAANLEVTLALIEAAEELGVKYHVGITVTSDSFYCGQGRPGFNDYFPKGAEGLVEELRKMNVLNFEMEASTLFVLSSIYGLRSGCVCAVYANRATNEFKIAGETECIKVALEAVKILSEWDELKNRLGVSVITPSAIKKYWRS